MEDEKFYCWVESCENEIPPPEYCCNGKECGCQGLPIDPPFCSDKCFTEYIDKKSKKLIETTKDIVKSLDKFNKEDKCQEL